MQIQRVSNAGVLLELDGVRMLLDGFNRSVGPYLATPQNICQQLFREMPDLLAFTHGHEDHFHDALVAQYRNQTLRPVLGPENLPYGTTTRGVALGGVSIQPVKSRHLGKEFYHIPHVSYVVRGSKTVWFLGDAAPGQWHDLREKADVIIAPFAYGLSDSAWHLTCEMADTVILVHMPLRENDPANLWQQVENITGKHCPVVLHMPEIGENIVIV